ncbi:winged helix-turn-helix domain-containing protein [Streptomyces sp. NPDC006172]|uniref:ArsR/SmtB family transcription factor n=1 Tax=Streptomyces sp. NPDC006172 TaxID=3154470 RepID=UPI00340758A8
MLRIHFTDADLARTRVARAPDPLWEIAFSLHRFQTRQGRWAYADWYRATTRALRERGLARAVSTALLPLFFRGAYYPDLLTPAESRDGLAAGLAAVADTPAERVRTEVRLLAKVSTVPSWMLRLGEREVLRDVTATIRAYHDLAIAPYGERIQSLIDADRSARARCLLDGGTEGMLGELGPTMRWRPPVLHVDYPVQDRDLHLRGRGLRLVPSYFLWHGPVALADPALEPVLVYPLHHRPTTAAPTELTGSGASLAALLGRTRTVVLRAAAVGATTGELARLAGLSASGASRHAAVLREAGLITSHRRATMVLHTLTPLGAALLRAERDE